MTLNNPYQTYQKNIYETASPAELTLMLYNGCLKFILRAKKDIESNNIQSKHQNLIKAQNIISELTYSLNMDYEISQSMYEMYQYINERLREVNISNDTTILNEVEELVTEFRDTWKQAMQVNRQKQYGTGIDHSN